MLNKNMSFNINHPTFNTFFNNVNGTVLNNTQTENYFVLPLESKMNVVHSTFKLIKSTLSIRFSKLTDKEIKDFVEILWKRNEELENYTFCAILRDIYNNFDSINTLFKPKRKSSRTVKVDKSSQNDTIDF